jgi:hypothetical protein
VDALALMGVEGRSNRRNVSARWKQPMTRKYPNEKTRYRESGNAMN